MCLCLCVSVWLLFEGCRVVIAAYKWWQVVINAALEIPGPRVLSQNNSVCTSAMFACDNTVVRAGVLHEKRDALS